MSERVYLAGRFGRRPELRAVADELRAAGHVVTSQWLLSETPHTDLRHGAATAAAAAARDLQDVRSATVCIAFAERPGDRQGRGGRHVEFGAAAALGLRLVVVGAPEHVFHLLPGVEQYPSWAAAAVAFGCGAGTSSAAA